MEEYSTVGTDHTSSDPSTFFRAKKPANHDLAYNVTRQTAVMKHTQR